MKYTEIDLKTATKEDIERHKEFIEFVDQEGRILANIENMKYYLSCSLSINEFLGYRSCISAFTTVISALYLHSLDGNSNNYYENVAHMNALIDKLKLQMEDMEKAMKEIIKSKQKETLN